MCTYTDHLSVAEVGIGASPVLMLHGCRMKILFPSWSTYTGHLLVAEVRIGVSPILTLHGCDLKFLLP